MKRRVILIVLGALGTLAVLYYAPSGKSPAPLRPVKRAKDIEMARRFEPAQSTMVVVPPVDAPPPQPVRLPPPTPIISTKLEIPIQDRATHDFSIGAPVIRSGGADTAALELALKQMDEATKNIQFPPTAKK